MKLIQQIFTVVLLLLSLSAMAAEPMPIEKSKVIVFINGQKFYVHTVRSGDTLYSIAKAYGVKEDIIKQHNPSAADGLKIDQAVRIPVPEDAEPIRTEKKRKKEYIAHKVKAGQTLYSIARDYNISVAIIREDNPSINPQTLSIGETLWIRRADVGQSSEEQAQEEMNEYVDNLNKATDDDYEFIVVKPGETIYSLSRQHGLTEAEFAELNDISNGLKAGAMIRIPRAKESDLNDIDNAADEAIKDAASQTHSADENIVFRAIPTTEQMHIALMLPMDTGSRPNASYVEFYQGFLLGMEKLKQMGKGNAKLSVYNTQHDPIKVQQIVSSPAFAGTDLIVGPVYEDELKPVVEYAHANSVPVVSPLANLVAVKSPAIYQLSPDQNCKYDKIDNLIDGGRDIYLMYASSFDKEFEQEILKLLEGTTFASYTYSFNQKSILTPRNAAAKPLESVDEILKQEKPALFIVLANLETDVDRILGTLSSSKVALTERSEKCADYAVLGTSRWSRFNNIDQTTFFNNNVVMISTYHAKRDSSLVKEFDSRYIESFNTLPSLYAYRGYDTAMIFCQGMRSEIEYSMLDKLYKPLQTGYKFFQTEIGGKYINREWVRINYNNNYTITIE